MTEKTIEQRIAFTESKSTDELAELALQISQEIDELEKNADKNDEIIEEKIDELGSDYWIIVQELHKRGSDKEFELCKKLANSSIANERALSADILGQLAYQDKDKYYEFAVTTLIQLLNDTDEGVLNSAATSLGHRLKEDDFRAVGKLCALANHPDKFVRNGVVFGLSKSEHPKAIAALIQLFKDKSDLVRDWATFSLGSIITADTPEIREILHFQLDDEDFDVRGEAFVGLAERGDYSMLNKLKQELSGEFEGSYVFRASAMLGEPSLLPYLHRLQENFEHEMTSYHKGVLADAIEACTKGNSANFLGIN